MTTERSIKYPISIHHLLKALDGLWSYFISWLILIGFSSIIFIGLFVKNPITGENQYIFLSRQQEIAIGLQSAPIMIEQFNGLDTDLAAQEYVSAIGRKLLDVDILKNAQYPFEFHLLADRQIANAFALPSGQVFITRALYDQLQKEDQIASVLAHEIVHVVARHATEQTAVKQLSDEMILSIQRFSRIDRLSKQNAAGAIALFISQVMNTNFARKDELQADRMAVIILNEAGYDPHAMNSLMAKLDGELYFGNMGSILSSHPTIAKRIQVINESIDNLVQGVNGNK